MSNAAALAPSSGRADPPEYTWLVWAFAISIAVHLVLFAGYYAGKRYDIWNHLPAWLKPLKTLVQVLKTKPTEVLARPSPPKPEDVPVVFVDVSPAQATAEPPKNASFYSDKNSKAANPEADKLTNVPKISGTQEEMAKTEDVDKFVPLQPTRPPQPAPQPKQEELIPKTTLKPGDLTMAKPDLAPKKGEGQAEHARPRTIEEAMNRQQQRQPQMPGRKMKQEGGVSHRLEIASLDAKATPFGAYDAALVDAIANSWYKLLDEQEYAADYRGKVVLRFQLHADGRITDVSISENTAGAIPGLLCETAVDKPNPFEKFPPDMRRVTGEIRHIQFTFFYY